MSGVRSVLLLCWRDTGHPQGGGSETYLQRIGAQLAAAGVDVTLRTARYPGAARREVIDGVRIRRAGGRYSVYVWALLAMAAARLGIGPLRAVRPDVVVDTQNGLPFLARLIYGRRVAVLVHHCHREQWPVAGRAMGRLGWFVESRVSPRLHRRNQYVTVSLPSARDLVGLGVGDERIALVRNGLDEAPAASLGISDAVTFHGHIGDVAKHQVMQQSWVHLLPSRKEGWGLAVVEAAQHAVPTIGYRSSGGLSDSIVDGVTGILVDDRAELVDRLDQLLSDPVLRDQLGAKAQTRSSEFSWTQSAEAARGVLQAVHDGRFVGGVV